MATKKTQPTKRAVKNNRGDTAPQGIGELCYSLIAKGKPDDAILKAVKAKFPKAKTSLKSLAWYHSKASKR